MNGFKRYKFSVIIKALVIPIIITLVTVLALNFIAPRLQEQLPNGTQYVINAEEAEQNE